MAKLPPEVRVQIARNTTQDVWKISDLLSVIQMEVEAREISENVKVNSEHRKEPATKPQRNLPTAATLVSRESPVRTVNNDRVPQCVYCAARHFSASCDRVTDILARKEILKRDKICFVSPQRSSKHAMPFKQGLSSLSWKSSSVHLRKTPSLSQGCSLSATEFPVNHATLSQEPTPSLPFSDPNPTFVSHTNATSGKGQYKVLLQTVATYAQGEHQSNPVPVRILLDSGSQRSYCTNALKQKLGLVPTKTETLNLNTFGDERFTKQRCDLVKLSLQGMNEDIEISALCFQKICSPLPTTLDVTRYPHLQGLQLADINIADGNHPNIDILIGSDYYYDIVTGEII